MTTRTFSAGSGRQLPPSTVRACARSPRTASRRRAAGVPRGGARTTAPARRAPAAAGRRPAPRRGGRGGRLAPGVLPRPRSGGTAVGVLDLYLHHPEPGVAHVGLLLFRESCQGHRLRRGDGGRARARARARRLRRAAVSVGDENPGAQAFWERIGFAEMGRLDGGVAVYERPLADAREPRRRTGGRRRLPPCSVRPPAAAVGAALGRGAGPSGARGRAPPRRGSRGRRSRTRPGTARGTAAKVDAALDQVDRRRRSCTRRARARRSAGTTPPPCSASSRPTRPRPSRRASACG